MSNIILDVTNKKSISASTISYEGKLLDKVVCKAKFDNQYLNLIDGYIKGAKLVKSFLDKNPQFSEDLIVVSSNSAFIGWLKRNYTLPQYADMFKTLTKILESLPVKIEFIRSDNLVSDKFAMKSFLKLEQLSSIDSFLDS